MPKQKQRWLEDLRRALQVVMAAESNKRLNWSREAAGQYYALVKIQIMHFTAKAVLRRSVDFFL